jgi:hypothetical protein
MSFYPLELQRVEGWSVVQPPARRVLLHPQQQGATRPCGKVQNTVRALYSVGQHGPTNACIKFTHLLFRGEQFQTKLAGFEEDNGEIV